MKLKDAIYWARWHTNRHGLSHFSIAFFRQPYPLAWQCGRSIALSMPFVLMNDMSAVVGVLEHEIAHALAPRGSEHNDGWRRVAFRQVGINSPSEYFPNEKMSADFSRYCAAYTADSARFEAGERAQGWIASILYLEAGEHKPGTVGETDLRFTDYGSF